MTASRASIATCWPALAATSATVPATGAVTVCSIFIASTTATACPADTVSPGATCTARTVPGMGDRTVPSLPAARPPRTGAASSSVSAHACPPRPSQIVAPSVANANRSTRPP